MTSDDEYLLKISLVGKPGSVKTRFIRSFAEGKFDRNDLPTLGVDITTKKITIGNIQVKLILVDTAGQEFFGKLRPSYYRGASALIIFFDKCDPESFKIVPNWLQEFQRFIPTGVPIALVGFITQCEDGSKEVSPEEGQELATQLNMKYFEASPTDSQQAQEIFAYLAKTVIEED
ncbi:MAG: Rab family GTPase [Candidatus Hodarchaeales archaeon]